MMHCVPDRSDPDLGAGKGVLGGNEGGADCVQTEDTQKMCRPVMSNCPATRREFFFQGPRFSTATLPLNYFTRPVFFFHVSGEETSSL